MLNPPSHRSLLKLRKTLLGLTQVEWKNLFIVFVLLFLILNIIFSLTYFWMILGLCFSIFVLIHIALANARYIVFPGFASFISCLQLIIAPTLSYQFPPVSPSLQFGAMVIDQGTYFSFATPAMIALWLGLHIPLKKVQTGLLISKTLPLNYRERRFMDVLIAVGFAFSIAPIKWGESIGLGFFIYILSQIRFVGALSWLVTKTKGWQWRIGFVLFTLFTHVLSSGVFYELILWGIFVILTLSYVQKWKWKIIPYTLILILSLIILNNVKPTFRNLINIYEYSTLQRINLVFTLISDNLADPWNTSTYSSPESEIGDRLVRYNQGWIVSRVIRHVPSQQYYGYGETIVSALNDAIVPRIFNPNNPGSHKNTIIQFQRYTGYQISGVSMGLGILGESFANFGRLGGISIVFIYGLGIGYIFSKLTGLAVERNIIWLAWIPFLLLTSLQAEWGFTLILNSLLKSFYVFIILIYFIPFLHKRLLTKGNRLFL